MRTIVHLSDLHFGRLDPGVVTPLLAAVNETAPDLVAISGDFTQRARRRQFSEARQFLRALTSPLLVVPGNHDVPLYNVLRRFLSPLGRYREFIANDVEPVFSDDEFIAIGLNSARSLTFGRGRLDAHQVGRAADRLRAASAGLIRIVVTHHPFDLPDDYDSKHLVGRARMAMTQLAAVGADLFLAGHLHVSHIGRTAERYRIAGHSALVRLNRPHVSVERRMWDDGRQTFVTASVRTFERMEHGWQEQGLGTGGSGGTGD
jgi:3',5'-cyclic AMP phosphodiesterase CpdA